MRETHYAKTKDAISIAYQVLGGGPVDLVWLTGFTGSLEIMSEQPLVGDFFEKLGQSFRGSDTIGADRAFICGSGWGAAPAVFFGATYPARTRALVLHPPYVRVARAPDYRRGITKEASLPSMGPPEQFAAPEQS